MDKYVKQVKEFHVKFGIHVGKRGSSVPVDVMNFRGELIEEETTEFLEDFADMSKRDILDSLGDIKYGIAGTILSIGMQSRWRSVNFPGISTTDNPEGLLLDCGYSILRSINTLKTSYHSTAIAAGVLSQMDSLLAKMCVASGLTEPIFHQVFSEIHRSNMSKMGGLHTKDGKIKKGPGFIEPDLDRFIKYIKI